MRLTGVDPSCPNPSTPWRRCRHKSLTDRLKPSDECCQNCVSWTDTSTALLCGETERFSACSVEQNLTTTCSCAIWQNEANFSQFIQYLTNKTVVIGVEGHRPCLHGKRGFCSA